MKKILRGTVAFLVCISLIRAVNGVGPVSLYAILLQFQAFTFDVDTLSDILSYIVEGDFLSIATSAWDSSRTGILGFFQNVGNAIGGGINSMLALISSVFALIGLLFKEFGSLLYHLLKMALSITGFMH